MFTCLIINTVSTSATVVYITAHTHTNAHTLQRIHLYTYTNPHSVKLRRTSRVYQCDLNTDELGHILSAASRSTNCVCVCSFIILYLIILFMHSNSGVCGVASLSDGIHAWQVQTAATADLCWRCQNVSFDVCRTDIRQTLSFISIPPLPLSLSSSSLSFLPAVYSRSHYVLALHV